MNVSTDEPQARIEAIGDQLRAKISSKFQTSTFLAGFGFAVLTVQLSTFWQSPKFPYLLPTSISFMIASLFLYIAAVIKLDELTMPKRSGRKTLPGKTPMPQDWRTSQIMIFGNSRNEWCSIGCI